MLLCDKLKKVVTIFGVNDMPGFWMLFKQFIKFGIVGVSNTLIFLAVYYCLVHVGVHYISSYIIGFIVSVINAFFWNSKFVFKVKGFIIRRFTKVTASYGFTLLLSTGLLYLMVDVGGISQYIAPLLNLIMTIPLNFLLNKFWAFK
jgi:putative flippase GtrA